MSIDSQSLVNPGFCEESALKVDAMRNAAVMALSACAALTLGARAVEEFR